MNQNQILSIMIMLLFYSVYIIKLLLLKRKGIDVNRLAKGDKAIYTRLLELLLIFITYAMVIIQCLSILRIFTTLSMIKHQALIGFIIAMVGTIFFTMAIISMKDSWRAGIDYCQKTTLITKGILKYSRNPAFLGFDLFYIGIALMIPNVIIITMTCIALVLFHLQILEEEKFLTTIFGEDYLAYKQKVRRYL